MVPSAMALLLVLVGLLSAAAGIAAPDMPINSHNEQNFGGRSDQEVKKLFEKWIGAHDKSYNGLMEKEKRFGTFKDNLRYIDQHNAGSHSYKLGFNRFYDLTNKKVSLDLLNHQSGREKRAGAFTNATLRSPGGKTTSYFDRLEGLRCSCANELKAMWKLLGIFNNCTRCQSKNW